MASPTIVSGVVKANKSAGCYFNVTTASGQQVATNLPRVVADALLGKDGPAIMAFVAERWASIRAAEAAPVAA